MFSKGIVGVYGLIGMSGVEMVNKLGLITEKIDSIVQVIVGLVTIYMLLRNKNRNE